MIRTANYNTLGIVRATENGVYLAEHEGYAPGGTRDEVLLPRRYVPEEYNIGDTLEVFVYHDSEDRLVATTEHPRVTEGGVACLEVVGTNPHGAFLDWGLPKDLFIPRSNQSEPMRTGERHVVAVYVDRVSGRPVATTKLGYLVNNEEITVRPREEVSVIVAGRRDRGFRVIINQRHWGMIYDSQIFTSVHYGDMLTAYVTRIVEGNKIDLALQQNGFNQVKDSADVILGMLRENSGTLGVGDDTSPEEVRLHTGMSKKLFKRAVGHLMSRGLVVVGPESVELTPKGNR